MKNLLLLLIFPFILGACSKDEEKDPPKVVSIQIQKPTETLFVGGEYQLNVIHTPNTLDAPTYNWESENTPVATVGSNGKLKAIREGRVTINVKAGDLKSSIELIISPIEAKTIKFSKNAHEIIHGESFYLSHTIEPESTTNKGVTWYSSDENIVSISYATVKAENIGQAYVYVRYSDQVKDSCLITVLPPIFTEIKVTGVNIAENFVEMEDKDVIKLVAEVIPENANNKNISWSSSDKSILAVDNDGNVTSLKEGSATITAITEDGEFTASANVSVYSFTSKISVGISQSTVSAPWGTTLSTNAKLKNDSKKTITAKKVTIYENGVFLSELALTDIVPPNGSIEYGVKRHGYFGFTYEYQFDGKTYTTN